MTSDFLTDPLWYKDAVIYELHVRSFFDANDDGYGDFSGLRQKLPYLESLGVNTLWLLPFLESPLRDDGYDTADYKKVLPVHGGLDDFKAFLDEAHARGMRVVTELVLNHTSDQHPWFQEARNPDSEKHDWYVWSDTADKYADVRIIFTDTETSNWSWDTKAQKYYWHRFFSHQPDLNYDHPEVRETMKEVMFFWLDLGVDGLRLDAVPYLFEREGTSCENLPETIDYIVELRQAVEDRYGPGKVLLAEANQWPEDTLPYFADGRGVQMSFNFPIMPRMYLSLRRENRRPLVEMLKLTEGIPADAQWAIFLRNHDELTLEMVTDEERDFMNHEYAADPRFRINVGIRRRLAPLLGGDRRQIELLNALLLSLPGSPVLYYGDEIGMGDDPFLGDRNGVRTPMQWSPDKNGGFSRAPHHRLFMPAITRGPYANEFVNVEDAEADPHSLLHVMRRVLAVRKQHAGAFGRGSFHVLPVENEAILAFVREHEGDRVLVVANLSRFAQSASLPEGHGLEGLAPVELFGRTVFPTVGEGGYPMMLAPYQVYWFAMEPEAVALTRPTSVGYGASPPPPHPVEAERAEIPQIRVPEGIENLLVRTLAAGGGMEALEALLPDFLNSQRWFAGKAAGADRVRIADAVRIRSGAHPVYLSILHVETADASDRYLFPLTTVDHADAEALLTDRPQAAVAWLDGPHGRSLLVDATALPEAWLAIADWWRSEKGARSLHGLYAGQVASSVRSATPVSATPITGEQSNSAALVTTAAGETLFVKLYRRLDAGPNPEVELLAHLTDAGFHFAPGLLGTATFTQDGEAFAMGVVQEALLDVERDGWAYAVESIDQFYDRVGDLAVPETPARDGDVPPWFEELAPEMLELTRTLGVRTAEMHLALADAEAEALCPEPTPPGAADALADRVAAEAEQTRALIAEHAPDLDIDTADWDAALARLDATRGLEADRHRIRVHGDYHLGQTLIAGGTLHVLDFEGEPSRSAAERRQRDDALRDVAGMLRSFAYAVYAPLAEREAVGGPLDRWAAALLRGCEASFLDAYLRTAGDAPFLAPAEARRSVLWAYLLDKALYEVRYELGSRPAWAWIPLRSLSALLCEPAEA